MKLMKKCTKDSFKPKQRHWHEVADKAILPKRVKGIEKAYP